MFCICFTQEIVITMVIFGLREKTLISGSVKIYLPDHFTPFYNFFFIFNFNSNFLNSDLEKFL